MKEWNNMITVVVSIYNVEKYLDRCINSLLHQTYKDFELILVDDGSPDQCPAMCDEWTKKDPRITAYHKENGGLSSARNFGIERAKGEYIIFPDPDDWVEPNYLEKLLILKNEHHADLSICGHYPISKGEKRVAGCTVMNTNEAMKQLMMPKGYCGYAWNKLYRMDTILDNDLRFDVELGMVQDLHFNVRYFQFCKSVVYDPVPLYHYSIDTGGVTSRFTPLTPRKLSGLLTYLKIAEFAHGKYPYIEECAYSSLCRMCLEYIYLYYKRDMQSKEILDMLTSTAIKYRKYFVKSRLYNFKDKGWSWSVKIHPKVYYYARRLHWHTYVPIARKLALIKKGKDV